jgi:hypothetical protein
MKDRAVYRELPDRFRFADVRLLPGGSSDSNATRLIKLVESKQLAREAEDGKGYVKVKT